VKEGGNLSWRNSKHPSLQTPFYPRNACETLMWFVLGCEPIMNINFKQHPRGSVTIWNLILPNLFFPFSLPLHFWSKLVSGRVGKENVSVIFFFSSYMETVVLPVVSQHQRPGRHPLKAHSTCDCLFNMVSVSSESQHFSLHIIYPKSSVWYWHQTLWRNISSLSDKFFSK